ncbi:MAG: 30S ribosomal protein S16 [Buchnera aphidicola (Meitanaphis microgallis)]
MVKIRLSRLGTKKRPFYQIVTADNRCPRNGKFIEKIGFFNPISSNNNISIDMKRLQYWIKNGAMISDRIKNLIKNLSTDAKLQRND